MATYKELAALTRNVNKPKATTPRKFKKKVPIPVNGYTSRRKV